MVYLTGDTHGDFSRFKCSAARKIKKGDTLIVLGDFGFFWDNSKRERAFVAKLSKLKYNVLFLDGAHENFDLLHALPDEELHGGRVKRAGDGVYYLQRGEIYTIEGKSYFTFGGGGVPDDEAKNERSLSSREEIMSALKNLKKHDNRVDYILTHEPSQKTGGYVGRNPNPSGTAIFLTAIEDVVSHDGWYFGSLHMDKIISKNHRALFREIIAIGD